MNIYGQTASGTFLARTKARLKPSGQCKMWKKYNRTGSARRE
jgi:hypothetical protein